MESRRTFSLCEGTIGHRWIPDLTLFCYLVHGIPLMESRRTLSLCEGTIGHRWIPTPTPTPIPTPTPHPHPTPPPIPPHPTHPTPTPPHPTPTPTPHPPHTHTQSQQRGFIFLISLDKRLNKRSDCQWFETMGCSLWRYCNVLPNRH